MGKFWPPKFGGIESVNYGLHDWLNTNGVFSVSLVYDNSKLKEFNLIKKRFILLFNKLPISISYLVYLFRNVRHFDVVHFHFPNPLVLIFFFINRTRGSNSRYVIHWHSDLIINKWVDRLYNFLVSNYVFRNSDSIVVTSETYAKFSDVLGKSNLPIDIIPNFLLKEAQVTKLTDRNLSLERISLLTVGRNTYYKGHRFLVEVMKFLPNNYHLTVVGDDVELLNVPNEVKGRVELCGRLSDKELDELFRRSHIFLLGSNTRAEAFGIVLIEAMFYGLPTVCFRIEGSGVLDVVIENKTGILVDICEIEMMAKAIVYLASDNSRYSSFSENAIERALSLTSDRVCPKFLELYQKMGVN